MRRFIMAGALVMLSSTALANQLYRPDVQVNVPPEVFGSAVSGRSPVISAAFIRIKTIRKAR